jgi:hypothetical protein
MAAPSRRSRAHEPQREGEPRAPPRTTRGSRRASHGPQRSWLTSPDGIGGYDENSRGDRAPARKGPAAAPVGRESGSSRTQKRAGTQATRMRGVIGRLSPVRAESRMWTPAPLSPVRADPGLHPLACACPHPVRRTPRHDPQSAVGPEAPLAPEPLRRHHDGHQLRRADRPQPGARAPRRAIPRRSAGHSWIGCRRRPGRWPNCCTSATGANGEWARWPGAGRVDGVEDPVDREGLAQLVVRDMILERRSGRIPMPSSRDRVDTAGPIRPCGVAPNPDPQDRSEL